MDPQHQQRRRCKSQNTFEPNLCLPGQHDLVRRSVFTTFLHSQEALLTNDRPKVIEWGRARFMALVYLGDKASSYSDNIPRWGSTK